MVIGPRQYTISSAAATGWITLASVSELYIGAIVNVTAAGQDDLECKVVDIVRGGAAPKIKVRLLSALIAYGGVDVSAYGGGTVFLRQQNLNLEETRTEGSFADLSVLDSATFYGLLYPPSYATSGLPTASSTNLGSLVYDVTSESLKYSDGTNWNEITSSGTGVSSLATPSALTYWVDQAAGSDDNDGLTAGTAFQTLTRAVNQIPLIQTQAVTVNVKAGTYNERLDLELFRLGGSVDIVGQDWTTVTPTTGTASGTLDAAFTPDPTKHVATVAGAGWTVGDLRGKFIHITSGANSGAYLPIVDNDADTLWLSMPAVSGASFARAITSATFDFAVPAAIIGREGSNSALIYFGGGSHDVPNLNHALRLKNLTLDKAAAGTGIYLAAGASLRAETCQFLSTGASSGNMIDASAGGSLLYLFESVAYFSSTGGVFVAVGSNGCSINCRNAGQYAGQYFLNQGSNGVGANVIFSGTAIGQSVGLALARGGVWTFNAHLYCTNGTHGIYVNGSNANIVLTATSAQTNVFLINSKSTAGVFFAQNTSTSRSGNSLTCYNGVVIDSCTTGIKVEAPFTCIDISAATVTNNSAWGVNLGAHKVACFNACHTSSSTSMSGNTSGDFSLDGTAATSIAALRADGDKDIAETIRFNRLAET